MASQQQFPPQKQESQPGKEHLMDPRPEAITQHYKAANKLQVIQVFDSTCSRL